MNSTLYQVFLVLISITLILIVSPCRCKSHVNGRSIVSSTEIFSSVEDQDVKPSRIVSNEDEDDEPLIILFIRKDLNEAKLSSNKALKRVKRNKTKIRYHRLSIYTKFGVLSVNKPTGQ